MRGSRRRRHLWRGRERRRRRWRRRERRRRGRGRGRGRGRPRPERRDERRDASRAFLRRRLPVHRRRGVERVRRWRRGRRGPGRTRKRPSDPREVRGVGTPGADAHFYLGARVGGVRGGWRGGGKDARRAAKGKGRRCDVGVEGVVGRGREGREGREARVRSGLEQDVAEPPGDARLGGFAGARGGSVQARVDAAKEERERGRGDDDAATARRALRGARHGSARARVCTTRVGGTKRGESSVSLGASRGTACASRTVSRETIRAPQGVQRAASARARRLSRSRGLSRVVPFGSRDFGRPSLPPRSGASDVSHSAGRTGRTHHGPPPSPTSRPSPASPHARLRLGSLRVPRRAQGPRPSGGERGVCRARALPRGVRARSAGTSRRPGGRGLGRRATSHPVPRARVVRAPDAV